MNKRHFIHEPSELLKIGMEIVKQSNDEKYIRKVTLVNLMLERKITNVVYYKSTSFQVCIIY